MLPAILITSFILTVLIYLAIYMRGYYDRKLKDMNNGYK